MTRLPVTGPGPGFSIGVCASDSAPNLVPLVRFLLEQSSGLSCGLRRLTVVASGCEEATISALRAEAESDSRVAVVVEPERRGKAEAINRIVENSEGEYLIFVNADAVPEAGSIRKLLSLATGSESVGCVSGSPEFEGGTGLFGDALGLMWSAHNLVSERLNHAGLSNHSSDELLLVRRSLMSELPHGLVNDGAYIGGLATARGLRVLFCDDARVRISVPSRPYEMVRQRRRIIFGHIQVWKRLGTPPRTMESLLFTNPVLSLKLLVALLARRPKSILTLPVVAAAELVSGVFAVVDWAISSDRHVVWRRIGV